MTPYQWTLAIGMIITGTLNTIFNKVQDWQHAPGKYGRDYCPGPDWSKDTGSGSGSGDANPAPCAFSHPFFQALCMFIGEALCLSVFYFMRCRGSADGAKAEPLRVNPFRFALPALCDMTATSLMYIGLLLTYASNFQMLRGSAVLFTGIISRIFLKRKLQGFHWAGMLLVLVGTALVGLDAVINPDTSASAPNPPLGNALIVLAQVVVAVQFCVEELFISSQNVPPLLAVGLEGIFGMLIAMTLLVVFYFTPGVEGLSISPDHFEDALDAMQQLGGGNALLVGTLAGATLSIAFFNYFGVSVTKSLSAAHRIVLDSVRTCSVWIFSLSVYAADPTSGHGQRFEWLQVAGFGVLLLGTLVYYEIVRLPCFSYPRPDTEPLLLPTSTTESIPPVEPLMAPSVQYPSRRT